MVVLVLACNTINCNVNYVVIITCTLTVDCYAKYTVYAHHCACAVYTILSISKLDGTTMDDCVDSWFQYIGKT